MTTKTTTKTRTTKTKMTYKAPETKLVFKNIAIPIIEFTLSNGVCGRGLVDTGSEGTLVDAGFLKANKAAFAIKPTSQKMNFVGFYGSEDRHLIKVSAFLKFDGNEVLMKDAIVAPLDNVNKGLIEMYGEEMAVNIVFGSDFFAENKAEINYQTNKLVFHD